MPIYRCTVKGCDFSTQSPSALISHAIDHRIAKVSSEQSSKPKFPHTTAKEMLGCPNCRAKIEEEFIKRGYERPEDVCPKCGERMKEHSIWLSKEDRYYCPDCDSWKPF